MLKRSYPSLILALSAAGCFDFSPTPFGEESYRCWDDRTCDAGLICNDAFRCIDPCKNIRCSEHGGCVVENGSPTCSCDSGYAPSAVDGTPDCLEIGALNAPCAPSASCQAGLVCEAQVCIDGCAQIDCGEHGSCGLEGIAAHCNCDDGYHEARGTCVDDCDGISCSGHGICVLTAGTTAECACTNGYVANGLNCVLPSCVPTSHDAQHCDSGSLYWYDSCGTREDIAASCGTRGCTSDACVAPTIFGLGGSLSGIFTLHTPNHEFAMSSRGNPTLLWNGSNIARWTGASWSTYPAPPPSSWGLGLDVSGAPYVAHLQAASTPSSGSYEELYISRWNGAWEAVGNAPTGLDGEGANIWGMKVGVNQQGSPYAVWSSFALYARGLNGATWAELGSGSASGTGISGQSGRDVTDLELHFTSTGDPVVMWVGRSISAPMTSIYLKRWNGTSWVEYGGSGSGLGLVEAPEGSFAMDGDNPWVAYQSGTSVITKRWNGSAWINVISGANDEVPVVNNVYIPRVQISVPSPGTAVIAWSRLYADNSVAILAGYFEDGKWKLFGETGEISTHSSYFFSLVADSGGGRTCIAWRQGNPTSAYVACTEL